MTHQKNVLMNKNVLKTNKSIKNIEYTNKFETFLIDQ